MWGLAIAINATALVLGCLWGPDALVQLWAPGIGPLLGAGLVSYSLRKRRGGDRRR